MKAVKLKPEVSWEERCVVIRPAILKYIFPYKVQGSVVTEVVRVPTGRSALRIPADSRYFPFSKTSALVLGSSSLLLNEYHCSFPGIKQPVRKVHHSPHLLPGLRVSVATYTALSPVFLHCFNRDVILGKNIAASIKVLCPVRFITDWFK
jgi:hypothetical protein